jgi:hypothetical protein
MNRERLTPDRIRRLTLPEGAGQSFTLGHRRAAAGRSCDRWRQVVHL